MRVSRYIVDETSALWTACELPHRCPQVFGTSLRVDATSAGLVTVDNVFADSQSKSTGLLGLASSHWPILLAQLCLNMRSNIVWVPRYNCDGMLLIKVIKES